MTYDPPLPPPTDLLIDDETEPEDYDWDYEDDSTDYLLV